MKSPAKQQNNDETPNKSNKKLVQALLPFKALSNATTTTTTTTTKSLVKSPNRKRKLSNSITEGAPAAKYNRKSVVKDSVDDGDDRDDVITIDLSTSECMEESVDLDIVNVNKENRFVGDKEEVGNDDDDNDADEKNLNEILCVDDDDDDDPCDKDDQKLSDRNDNTKAPKAKKFLDMGDDTVVGPRRSSRISDENFKIKLPLGKKANNTAKNVKKARKKDSDSTPSGNSNLQETFEENNVAVVLDDSIATEFASPSISRRKRSISPVVDSMNTTIESPNRADLNDSSTSLSLTPAQKLTPKQILRKTESEKKLLEKQRAKEDRERKFQEAKEQKQRERDEKERQRKTEREEREKKRQAELDEKEEQKKREREEKERKRLAELEDKKRRDEQKEEERRKREMQKEEERRKRDEERRQKDEEKRLKEDERRQKEEERRQKEEEKRQKEEEKRLREEADKLKSRKTAEKFVNFFVPKKTDANKRENAENLDSDKVQTFMSFQVKEDMKVAPPTRRSLLTDEKTLLDEKISATNDAALNELYLMELKQSSREIRKCGKTWITEEGEEEDEDTYSNALDNDVLIIDEFGTAEVIEPPPAKQIYRAKFFKFNENRRPPYYGTWRKKSTLLGARKPFIRDKTLFDYEIDSDDEWEEEEPGESIHGSEDGSDKEPEEDYDIDNEFFVPHGHLSDEEMQDDDYLEDNSPEAQKAKEKIAQKQFDDDCKRKTHKLKPRVIGLYWQNSDGSKPDNCKDDDKWVYLNVRAGMFTENSVILRGDVDDSDVEDAENKGPKRIQITEDAIPDLIRLVHGNYSSCKFMIKEFKAHIARKNEKENQNRKAFSDQSIHNKIKEIALKTVCEEPGPMFNKKCWQVHQKKRKEYGLTTLPLLNAWTYILKRKTEAAEKERETPVDNDSDSKGTMSQTITSATVKEASAKNASFNIARFIRALNEDEKKKQFGSLTLRTASPTNLPSDEPSGSGTTNRKKEISPTSRKKNSPSGSKPKKRVNLLMSVPRGENFSPTTKKAVLTDFFNQQTKQKKNNIDNQLNSGTSDNPENSNNDVIVLD